MVSIGNKAMLVSSDICQKCGKCCLEFNMGGVDMECALRLLWIEDRHIKVRESAFRDDFGQLKKDVCIKYPCEKLFNKNGKYYCSHYDKLRPDFCNTYPDSIFYSIEEWDVDRIKKMLEEGSKDCPALKHISVEKVQEMLTKIREGVYK